MRKVKKYLFVIFLFLFVYSCKKGTKDIDIANKSNAIVDGFKEDTIGDFYKNAAIYCGGNIVKANIDFAVTHSNDIDLTKYDLLIRVNSVIVYYGKFQLNLKYAGLKFTNKIKGSKSE